MTCIFPERFVHLNNFVSMPEMSEYDFGAASTISEEVLGLLDEALSDVTIYAAYYHDGSYYIFKYCPALGCDVDVLCDVMYEKGCLTELIRAVALNLISRGRGNND